MTSKQFNQKVNKIKRDRKSLLKKLSKGKFGTRHHMLFTLQTCYRHILDNMSLVKNSKRLTPDEEYELGQNLALYWNLKK